ncbi:hypothetical protein BBO99_00009248 [Phytophthora kernoviae]|uniref:Uncharacterized protein n=2 Tax=Phytophthora kernoviae TaxID=325452 RepID=A0A3R7JWE6_9STRA|nr:hypothetical protein G195_010918 [Phytophthora kernoviae 00238/432]KAG2506607.1 hypothetical protein JM16_009136 [Phytophthora kernoviae]KAG2508661.1 hypothetical protein JM18_009162 [Phytophthora kernoviae]RLN26364.1 hypothetical protein BBI17_009269 [Phytophthora kernoviae]RLN73769.1 hypothetical protein BBO99_00009248 [Phytophthora kernoviae]
MADVADGNVSEAASDAPLPPPPPPPPPPQLRPEEELKRKRQQQNQSLKPKQKKDFREILALFHDESMDEAQIKRVWGGLWQTTLAEAQEEHKRRRQQEQQGLKRKKDGLTPPRSGSIRHGGGPDHLKRTRQGSAASTDSSESGKSRLGGRFQKTAPKGSKLMQKLGTRGT